MELPGQQHHPDTSNGPEPSYQQQHQTYLQGNSTPQQQLWRQFQHDWYTNNNAMLAVDTTFYAASRQATLWRGPTLVVEEDHQVGTMLLAIVTVMAVPMRPFEVLQQTFAMHALVAVAFVAVHPAAALQGARRVSILFMRLMTLWLRLWKGCWRQSAAFLQHVSQHAAAVLALSYTTP